MQPLIKVQLSEEQMKSKDVSGLISAMCSSAVIAFVVFFFLTVSLDLHHYS